MTANVAESRGIILGKLNYKDAQPDWVAWNYYGYDLVPGSNEVGARVFPVKVESPEITVTINGAITFNNDQYVTRNGMKMTVAVVDVKQVKRAKMARRTIFARFLYF